MVFRHFTSHSKVVHSEDHFSEEGLFGSLFSKSRECEGRVNASVRKYHENKHYANLGFIMLQVTKGFISGSFSSERFSWKVKTVRCGLYILINKHLQYRCLEFTILKRMWPIFAKSIKNFSLEFRIKTFCLRSSQMILKHNLNKQLSLNQ